MRILLGVAVLALIATPAWANLLSDSEGGFEDPWPSAPNPWTGNIERDSSIHGPGGPHSGAHYGSVQTGGGGSESREIVLTSIVVPPSELVTLTGYVAGGTADGTPAQLWIQLIDGSSSGDVIIDQWLIDLPITYGFGWTPFTLAGHIASGHVKIKAGFHIGSWSNGTALHLDTLELVPEPTSLALLALAGLPLLRRRR